MADKKPSRRPLAGSRNPSRTPKRLAGQPARPDADVESAGEMPVETPIVEADAPADSLAGSPSDFSSDFSPDFPGPGTHHTEFAADAGAPAPGVLQKARTTRVLLALVAVAAVVTGVLGVLQFQEEASVQASASTWAPVSKPGEFKPPHEGELPVTVDSLEWTKAVDDIAHSVTKMLSFNHETIDNQDELAAELVTPEFLENELKQTFAETAPKLKESEAEYTVTVAGQSVISATTDRVRALLFVNQLVTKGSGKQAVSDNYPLRLDVEGVLVDGEWLISDLNAG